jgi:hypothetical protein
MQKWNKAGNKMLLWHGTRPENVLGILNSGFRIAPSDANRTGAMFGDGVYFADIFNKSFNYTGSSFGRTSFFGNGGAQQKLKEPKKYMFLCEVALGKCKKYYQGEDVTSLPNTHHQSVFGVGRLGPEPAGNIYLPNGCVIPIGNLVQTPEPKLPAGQYWGLQHNEFVVYDTSQVRIRYLLELR